jgi:hypothetical protein
MSDSTSYSTSINPGAPPLRWDNVYEAFRQVNANFEILEAALGAAGITPINFSDLDSSVIPSSNAVYVLGSITNQWKSVFTSSYSEAPGNEFNGLWAGSAQIKGVGFTVNLPAGSTIGGDPITGEDTELIIDPDKNWFKTIQIDGGDSIVATEVNDTFSILSGNGISLDVDSSAESIEITNTGILDVTAGTGISRTIVSGTADIVNTGVITLANTGSIGTRTSGLGIHVSSAAGNPIITNTGVLSIVAGSGALIVSTDAVTGVVTITNNSPAQPAFQQVEVDGDSGNRLVADSTAGVLRVVSGYGITLAKTVGTDTLTINVDPAHDIRGSVFADDSTVLVNAVDGTLHGNFIGSVFADDSTQLVDGNTSTIYGNIEATTLRTAEAAIRLGESAAEINQGSQAIAIGRLAGETNQGLRGIAIGHQAATTNQGQRGIAVGTNAGGSGQGDFAIAIGQDASNINQGTESIAVGTNAGGTNQGANSIAIGRNAGSAGTVANSIILNATGTSTASSAAGFYVDPIRSTANGRPLMYNTSTKELFSSSVLEFIGSTISTVDSSGITIDVQTTFNTDVTFENDITIAERLTVKGSRVINLTELKSIVVASSSFADFQSKIAALV